MTPAAIVAVLRELARVRPLVRTASGAASVVEVRVSI